MVHMMMLYQGEIKFISKNLFCHEHASLLGCDVASSGKQLLKLRKIILPETSRSGGHRSLFRGQEVVEPLLKNCLIFGNVDN
jgi:hypothetical protein